MLDTQRVAVCEDALKVARIAAEAVVAGRVLLRVRLQSDKRAELYVLCARAYVAHRRHRRDAVACAGWSSASG